MEYKPYIIAATILILIMLCCVIYWIVHVYKNSDDTKKNNIKVIVQYIVTGFTLICGAGLYLFISGPTGYQQVAIGKPRKK